MIIMINGNHNTKTPREKNKFSPDFKDQVAIAACKDLDTVNKITDK